MIGSFAQFDPNKLTRKNMAFLGDNIADYLMLLEEVMIFPEELEGNKEEFQEAIKTVKKLIKKLRKGDRSVFKSSDEEED